MDELVNYELNAPPVMNWHTADEFLGQLRNAPSSVRFVVDLSATSQIDAIGLGLLLKVLACAGQDKERVYLARAAGAVMDTLVAGGFHRIMNIGYPAMDSLL